MGITIDEALTNLESLQKDFQDFHDEVWKDPETYSINAESLKIAIDAMHKCQRIAKAIDKVEEYICDVETDTVKAQGMAQALDIFEQVLSEVEDGRN